MVSRRFTTCPGDPVEEEAVGLDEESSCRGVLHHLADEIGAKEGLAAVEDERGIGVLLKEPVEDLQIIVEFKGEIAVDVVPFFFRCRGKEQLPPAVGAGEVAVVGEDDMVVQEDSRRYSPSRKKGCP